MDPSGRVVGSSASITAHHYIDRPILIGSHESDVSTVTSIVTIPTVLPQELMALAPSLSFRFKSLQVKDAVLPRHEKIDKRISTSRHSYRIHIVT